MAKCQDSQIPKFPNLMCLMSHPRLAFATNGTSCVSVRVGEIMLASHKEKS